MPEGQCETAGSEGKALLWEEESSLSQGHPGQWLQTALVCGSELRWQMRPCAHGNLGWLFHRRLIS